MSKIFQGYEFQDIGGAEVLAIITDIVANDKEEDLPF